MIFAEGVSSPEGGKSPIIGIRNDSKSPPSQPPSPARNKLTPTSPDWPAQSDDDIDRLVAMHQNRSSLSSLGVSFVFLNTQSISIANKFFRFCSFFLFIYCCTQLRSDSMASVYSGAGEGRYGTVIVKGQVEFGMQYNYKQGALEIHVVQCKDLAAVDTKRNRSDPYVKVRSNGATFQKKIRVNCIKLLAQCNCIKSEKCSNRLEFGFISNPQFISDILIKLRLFVLICRFICYRISQRMANAKRKFESIH